jgi:fluoride exporter
MAKPDPQSLTWLWIGLGGGLGSVARHLASGWVARHFGATFPWGTLLVNVTGSLVIGLFAALTAPDGRWMVPVTGRQFFMIGVLGGYTTFSSFSLQTLTLAQDGEWLQAAGNVALSVLGCLAAVWLGWLLGVQLNAPKGG